MPPPNVLTGLLLLLTVTGSARAQSLSVADVIRLGLQRSPALQAARLRVAAARSALDGAGALPALRMEVAPGVGFTNGNAFLSREFDIAGARRARVQTAHAVWEAARARERLTRQQVALQLQQAYVDLVQAIRAERLSGEALALARALEERVARRVELGEAPAVQGTRAAIESARRAAEARRAQADVPVQRAALNRLLGQEPDAALTPVDQIPLPDEPAAVEALRARAVQQRPELAVAHAQIAARQGESALARTRARPTLLADLATDFWTLERRANPRPVGFQLRLSLPFGPDPALRAERERLQAERAAEEAEAAGWERTIVAEVDRARADLVATRAAALDYEKDVLPRVETLLRATRTGFEDGLTSFVDVLEAQRVAHAARQEYERLLFDALRARLALDAALGESNQ